jgi:hypothetical protein
MGESINLDLSEISRELILILELMTSNGNKKTIFANENLFTDINWDEFYRLVIHHRVYPVISDFLQKVNTKIPENILQKLSYKNQKNRFQMLYLSGEMSQIGKLFKDNDIRTVFLKGPVLGLDLYGDVSLRTSSDIDLLIPINDLFKAEELLLQNGYVKDDYITTILGDWKWRHHHITFFHKEKNIKVEIHWRLNPGPSKEPNFNDLWKRSRISSICNDPISILGKEDLFVFLVSHGSRHGWSRLRWLQDIDQILKQSLDWSLVLFLLKKYQLTQIAGQSLILSSNLLGTKLIEVLNPLVKGNRPKNLAQEAIFYIKQTINLHTYPLPKDIQKYHQTHLFSLMSVRQKLLVMASMLFPFPIDAKTLPLPKILHPLYFPLRPFLCAWRYTKKNGAH